MRTSCWETWPAARPRPPRCLLLKSSNRAPDALRRPLMPMAVVRNNMEEDVDADVWVDTDMDKDDILVVSERAVLNWPERDVFS